MVRIRGLWLIRAVMLYEKTPEPNPRGENRGAHVRSCNLYKQSGSSCD